MRYCMRSIHSFRNLSFNKASSWIKVPPKVEFDTNYLCNAEKINEIETNVRSRKCTADINLVQELYSQLQIAENESERTALLKMFEREAKKIPNRSYGCLNSAEMVKLNGTKKHFGFEPEEFSKLAERLRVLRTANLGNFAGHKSYYLMCDLAALEHALIRFTIARLLKRGFQLVSVPDILPAHIIGNCGMAVESERNQVYKLDNPHGPDICLSGTAEMALAGYVMNQTFHASQLPLRLAAVSRCFRAETSRLSEERGIYRVHQFTKVEMFAITDQDSSDSMLEEFREIQEKNFASLGLHLRTTDMPPNELGAPAYHKYDVEAWLPGRKMFGEVSSCSDCTDYQSRRLSVKYWPADAAKPLHAHTINGTACAIPRMLIALVETHQQRDGTVIIPDPLRPYMRGKKRLVKEIKLPHIKFMKPKHWNAKINI